MFNNFQEKNCIVTGGSGFIGQNLVKKLLDHNARVYVIDNFSFGAFQSNIDPRASVIEGDIRDYSVLEKLPVIEYHYFFHFAAPSSIILFDKDPFECFEITIEGFLNAMKYCVRHNIRLVYPSTGSLYSSIESPHAENSTLNIEAINIYAKAKLSLEMIHKSYKQKSNVIGLRIFAGYGPSEAHKKEFASVIYNFCQQMKNGHRPVIFGDGTQVRDFIYIDDIVNAILILAELGQENIINIGSGQSISFNKIIAIINEVLKTQIQPIYNEKPNFYLERTQSDIRVLEKYYKPYNLIKHGIENIIISM